MTTYASRSSGVSARRATACGSRWPVSTPAGSGSRPSRPAWPRAGAPPPAAGPGAGGALDHAVGYAKERETFGKRIIDHQGLAFVLADMEAAIQTARAMTLQAARLKDRGLPFSREAAIAKLVATDNAMKVTTDAVQVLGGYGYTKDFPVERYMREAKVMQIFEGTNQILRMVVSRSLDRDQTGAITHDA